MSGLNMKQEYRLSLLTLNSVLKKTYFPFRHVWDSMYKVINKLAFFSSINIDKIDNRTLIDYPRAWYRQDISWCALCDIDFVLVVN